MPNKILEKITLGGIFLIPIVPLIISDFLFFPYITGKNFLFRIIVEIIFAAWLIWMANDKNVRPKKSSLLIATFLFVIAMVISALLGDVPSKSFWSNYERMEGVVGYMHVFAFLFVLACTMTKERFKTFFHINLGVGTVVALYGLLQYTGVFLISLDGLRVDGTLGNPIYMAVYMLLCLFIALYYLITKDAESNYKHIKYTILSALNVFIIYLFYILHKVADGNIGKVFLIISLVILVDIAFFFFHKQLERNKGKVVKIIYSLLSILFVYLMYLTQTRGAFVGLLCGILFLCVGFAIFDKGKSKKGAIIALVVIVLATGTFFAIRKTSFIVHNPTFSRIASISLKDTTTSARLTIWGMAIEGFKEHPIFGWGNENFNLVFNKYYKPELITSEQWFDRSHNILLDWLSDTGLVGFILYLSLFGTAIFYLFKRNSVFSIKEKIVLTSLFVAYFVQNLFVFDNISGIMIFVSVLAYIYVRNFESKEVVGTDFDQKTVNVISALVCIALLFSLYYVIYKPIRVAHILNQATVFSATNRPAEALASYKKAIAYNTFGTREAREHLMISSQQAFSNPSTSNELNQQFVNESVSEAQKQLKEFSGDLRNYVLLGSYLKTYGLFDQAIKVLEEAKKLSPKKQAVYQILADIYIATKQFDKAISEAKTAYDIYPKSDESAKILAIVYMISGDQKSADELLIKQFSSIYIYDQRFMNIYASQKNSERIEGVWEKYIADKPDDLLGYESLYQIYFDSGRKTEAISMLLQMIRIREVMVVKDPNNVEQIVALSELYVKNGQMSQARTSIEKATTLTQKYITKHPDDLQAHLSLASFYLALGKKEESITVLQKALKISGAPTEEINKYINSIAKGENPWANQ